jgi:hypothetical protein
VTLNLEESAAREGADFRAAKASEQLDAPVPVRTAGGLGADEHELGWMGRMAGGVCQRDHAAE